MLIHDPKNEKLIKNFFGWEFVKNECGQAGHRTLKLAVSQN